MRRTLWVVMLLGVAVGTISCRTPDKPAAPGAQTRGPDGGAPTALPHEGSLQPALPATAFRLAPDNTKIEFVGSKGGKSHQGSFTQFTGGLDWQPNSPGPTRLSIDIDMNSISTSIGLLTSHLKGKDFFEVATYPKASFMAARVEPGQGPGSYVLSGNFTLHGVTKPMSIPIACSIADNVLTLNGRFTIRQSEFGMVEAARKTDDEVPITVSARVPRS